MRTQRPYALALSARTLLAFAGVARTSHSLSVHRYITARIQDHRREQAARDVWPVRALRRVLRREPSRDVFLARCAHAHLDPQEIETFLFESVLLAPEASPAYIDAWHCLHVLALYRLPQTARLRLL